MNGRAWYNENDPAAAAWLRELVAAGLIAPGDVDERSVVDVRPADLAGYTQCHFFAGIGGWSYALRLAGWPDDRPVWTGSCPCQPFSAAGKGKAADDKRHLWPVWLPLIAECRPERIFGEQVEAAIGWGWLDLVLSDLETLGYACGSAVLPAASVGAPHIRNRVWFVADASVDGTVRHVGDAQRSTPAISGAGHQHGSDLAGPSLARSTTRSVADAVRGGTGHAPGQGMGAQAAADSDDGSLPGQRLRTGIEGAARTVGDANGSGRETRDPKLGRTRARPEQPTQPSPHGSVADAMHAQRRPLDSPPASGPGAGRTAGTGEGLMGDANGVQPQQPAGQWARPGEAQGGRALDQSARSGDGRSFWSDAIWLPCTDGKARPTQPGIFPLAHGLSGRVGRLRGAGNAIVPQVAAEFVRAFLGITDGR